MSIICLLCIFVLSFLFVFPFSPALFFSPLTRLLISLCCCCYCFMINHINCFCSCALSSFFLSFFSLSLLFLPPDDRHHRIELLRDVILLRRFLRDRNLRRPLRLTLARRGVRVTGVKAIFFRPEHIHAFTHSERRDQRGQRGHKRGLPM